VLARQPNRSYISIIEQFVRLTQTQDSAIAAALSVSRNAYFVSEQQHSGPTGEVE